MTNDADWVEDVKRWYLASSRSNATLAVNADGAAENTDFALGYEAAHPALQARNWPDVPANAFEHSSY